MACGSPVRATNRPNGASVGLAKVLFVFLEVYLFLHQYMYVTVLGTKSIKGARITRACITANPWVMYWQYMSNLERSICKLAHLILRAQSDFFTCKLRNFSMASGTAAKYLDKTSCKETYTPCSLSKTLSSCIMRERWS